jgi:hypothetical protein
MPLLTVVVAMLLSGLVRGAWTNRWGPSGALEEAVSRLQGVPLVLGDWDGSVMHLSDREVALTEISGYLSRRYVNRRTGAVVSVLVVCGRPGPVSVHPPEVCYQGAGYEEFGAGSVYACPAGPGGKFQVRQFRKRNVATPTHLRLLYAWSASDAWAAPKYPRFTFARHPMLCKLYVVRELLNPDEALADSPESDLINSFLPELHRALFSS